MIPAKTWKKLQILTLASAVLIFAPHAFAQSAAPVPNTTMQGELRQFNQAVRDQNKIRACQVHERDIKNRANHLQNLVDKMSDDFGRITTRVENYYTKRLVPQGKTLSGYDSLVADIAAKKSAVRTDVEKTKSDIAGFSCSASADPKANLTVYRNDMQTVKKDLQNYRTSVKNLIVAVRGLIGQGSSPSANPASR